MESDVSRSGKILRATTNPAVIYLADLAKKGRFAIRGSLDAVAQRLGYVDAKAAPWHEMKAEHVAALRSWLSGTFEPATANRYFSALKGTLRVAWQAWADQRRDVRKDSQREGRAQILGTSRQVPVTA